MGKGYIGGDALFIRIIDVSYRNKQGKCTAHFPIL